MTPNWQEIEATLLAAYSEEGPCYAQALIVADQLAGFTSEPLQTEQTLVGLADLMRQIGAIDERVAPIREQWMAAKRQAGPQLAAAMKYVTRLIEQLRTKINELEKLATAKRDQLVPQMDGLLRSRQMKRAYASAEKYGGSRSG
jgi:cell division septum initiation protein DivIVA